MKWPWKQTPEQRLERQIVRAERDEIKRRNKNHEYLSESVAWEERGLCYFCQGRGSYNTWYDDGTVTISCSVCGGSGLSKNLGNLRELLKRGTAFDPKELRSKPNALVKALNGKVTAAP